MERFERVALKHIHYCRASENLLYEARSSSSGLCDTGGVGWEVEGRFKREGTYVYLWLIHADIQQKPTQCCKTIILQLKKKIKKNPCCEVLLCPLKLWANTSPNKGETRLFSIRFLNFRLADRQGMFCPQKWPRSSLFKHLS